MEKDMVFFGEKGLTSTSANHIANLAKEYVQGLQSFLDNIRLYNTSVGLIGSREESLCSTGIKKELLEEVPAMLNDIAEATSLIAWLREAIKAKENLDAEVFMYSSQDYCRDNGIEYPKPVERKNPLTEKEYYSSLSIKERNRYYQLEAKAAVFGKCIHPEGSLGKARKDLMNKVNNPADVQGQGRDTVIYRHYPTVAEQDVDELFFNLQDEYRNTQAALNSIKFGCEKAIQESKEACQDEYNKEMNLFRTKMEDIANRHYECVLKERRKVKDLKIIIPDSLKRIYEEVSQLGNKKEKGNPSVSVQQA